VTTAVTCPTLRIHPAVIAQAAATSAVLLGEGRFRLGVGTGEALNEHVLGDPWPEAEVRLEMLEEAVEVIRALWTGDNVSHRGRHYTVENARVWTRPTTPPPILVSAFGPKALDVAVRIGDGYVTTTPDEELLGRYRKEAGTGTTTHAGFKVAWADTEDEGIDHAYRIWPNSGLPGELSQVLPTVEHFEQASQLVTRDAIAESVVGGSDPKAHLEAYAPFVEAGFDEIYVANMGPNYADMIRAYGREVLPELRRG
jgi:G6PDH family F420-dependent oxidoreductase